MTPLLGTVRTFLATGLPVIIGFCSTARSGSGPAPVTSIMLCQFYFMHEKYHMTVDGIRGRVFAIFRRRRMAAFYSMFQPSPRTRLLDIGGAPNTWLAESRLNATFPVTLVNVRFPDPDVQRYARFTAVYGDATCLPFESASFDVAFSNSVIEHMTSWERQQAFAAEARRVATKLWIQTPARSFPLEPHLLAPFFSTGQRRCSEHWHGTLPSGVC